MKLNKGFIVFAVALFVIMLLIDMRLPRRFDWTETFSHYDENPFGCALMDSVLSASIPAGYSVTGKTLAQIEDENGKPATYLLVSEEISDYDVSIERLLNRGHNLIIATNSYSSIEAVDTVLDGDYIGFYEEFGSGTLKSMTMRIVRWTGKDNRYRKRDYQLVSPFVKLSLNCLNKNHYWTPLAIQVQDEGSIDTLALSKPHHGGRVTIATMPLLFTNYGISHDNSRELAMRLLTVGSNGQPIVRIDSAIDYANGDEKSESPFRYMLKHRPLRWALYMTVIGVLLALAFTARRRQRIIPVMGKPENHTLEMAEHIGTLYYERHDNHDMLEKKYFQFAAQLRRMAMVDLSDSTNFDQEVDALALYSTLPRQQLADDIKLVWAVLADESQPTNRLTAHLCDKMDAIIASIKQ